MVWYSFEVIYLTKYNVLFEQDSSSSKMQNYGRNKTVRDLAAAHTDHFTFGVDDFQLVALFAFAVRSDSCFCS